MIIFSIIYHIFGILLCTIFFFVALVVWVLSLPFDRGRKVVHCLNRFVTNIFFAPMPFWSFSVEGIENIDVAKSYVIVMNHTVMMDIPVMYRLPLYFKWVSKREVFYLPVFGQWLALRGDIAIRRGNGAESMAQVIEQGKRVIGWGQSVAIFPEGTRSKDGNIGRFKAGAFNLAKEAGVDILPVVIEGSDCVFSSKSGKYSWRNKITLRVLPAVASDWSDNVGCKSTIDSVRESMVVALADIRSNS